MVAVEVVPAAVVVLGASVVRALVAAEVAVAAVPLGAAGLPGLAAPSTAPAPTGCTLPVAGYVRSWAPYRLACSDVVNVA